MGLRRGRLARAPQHPLLARGAPRPQSPTLQRTSRCERTLLAFGHMQPPSCMLVPLMLNIRRCASCETVAGRALLSWLSVAPWLAGQCGCLRLPGHLQAPVWGAQVLREVAVALGWGPKRPRERRAPRAKQGTEGEDLVAGEGGALQLRLPPRFGAGTVKSAAWHVRPASGGARMTRLLHMRGATASTLPLMSGVSAIRCYWHSTVYKTDAVVHSCPRLMASLSPSVPIL